MLAPWLQKPPLSSKEMTVGIIRTTADRLLCFLFSLKYKRNTYSKICAKFLKRTVFFTISSLISGNPTQPLLQNQFVNTQKDTSSLKKHYSYYSIPRHSPYMSVHPPPHHPRGGHAVLKIKFRKCSGYRNAQPAYFRVLNQKRGP